MVVQANLQTLSGQFARSRICRQRLQNSFSRPSDVRGSHLRKNAPPKPRPNRRDRSVPRHLITTSPYVAPCPRRPVRTRQSVVQSPNRSPSPIRSCCGQQPRAWTLQRPQFHGADPHSLPEQCGTSLQCVDRILKCLARVDFTAFAALMTISSPGTRLRPVWPPLPLQKRAKIDKPSGIAPADRARVTFRAAWTVSPAPLLFTPILTAAAPMSLRVFIDNPGQ